MIITNEKGKKGYIKMKCGGASRCVIKMVTLMKKKGTLRKSVLYPWGKAVLTDSWIILHKHGDPKLAISYREKMSAAKMDSQVYDIRKNH